MPNLVPDGHGFRVISSHLDYQSPLHLINFDRQQRAQAAIAAVAISDIEKLIQVHESTLLNPKFDEKTKIHDWRNYVPLMIEAAWFDLTLRERALIYFLAKMQADYEEWD
jgi:hypothetical protein